MSCGDKMPSTAAKQHKLLNWIGGCFRTVHHGQNVVIEDKSSPGLYSLSPTVQMPPPISKSTFINDVLPHNAVASEYFWNFFTRYSEQDIGNGLEISAAQMADGVDRFYALITDKEQIEFYVKIFANGRSSIRRDGFYDLLISAYDLGFVAQRMNGAAAQGTLTVIETLGMASNDSGITGNQWIEAVLSSCFHLKEEMSVVFICNWIQSHLPRSIIFLHKYAIYQLSSAKAHTQNDLTLTKRPSPYPVLPVTFQFDTTDSTKATDVLNLPSDTGIVKRANVTGINPLLLWLLEVSLPVPYTAPLEVKPGVLSCPFTKKYRSTQELLQELRNDGGSGEVWAKLYDSAEQGTSVSGFQLNLFHYKGPTLVFIFAENDYTFCVGSDEEWKEISRFWGGEDSFLLQLQPEFRFIERGPKLLYTNFSIRGYPFGIQVGRDTKNMSLEIKPDFTRVSFKGIPCNIDRILAFGCGPQQAKKNQTEHKKWVNKQVELQRTVPKRNRLEWIDDADNKILGMAGVHSSYASAVNGDIYQTSIQKHTPRPTARVHDVAE